MPKTAVHYVPYPPPESDMSTSSYLVPFYEPISEAHTHQQIQTTATNYPPATPNVASAVMPITYSPQIYHGIPPHIGGPQPGSMGSSGPQMVYASAATLEMSNTVGPGCMVGSQQQQQYITIPMGYPYPYSGEFIHSLF